MTTLLHRECLKATNGLIIPDLGNIVNKFVGIIRIWLDADSWACLTGEGEFIVRSLERSVWGGSIDQVIGLECISPRYFAGNFHGHPCNWPFYCKVTFQQPNCDKWALIDPDANAIIGYH